MKRREFSSKEIERLRAYMAEPHPQYGALAALSRTLNRSPLVLRAKMAALKAEAPRQNYGHPGVIIDDFGVSHAQLIAELRDGTR